MTTSYNTNRLFLIALSAKAAFAVTFSIRCIIAIDLQTQLFDPVDRLSSAQMVGEVLGASSLGAAFIIVLGGATLDYFGIRAIMALSSIANIAGTLLVVLSPQLAEGIGIYWLIWSGMLLSGIGGGLIEAAVNPLIATLYPDDKTFRMNRLHAWWPGGIIIGGFLGILMGRMGLSWEMKTALSVIPTAVYGLMLIGAVFPQTARAASKVPASQMFKQALRPLFLLWFACMFFTASTELAPSQWVDLALSRTVGIKGIWILIYGSGVMFIFRIFSGPVVHRLSSTAVLWLSSLFAGAGLVLLSMAGSPYTALPAATLWGIGVAFMWPTMIASVADRFPKGGAFLIGLMGTAGTLSSFMALPIIGMIFDYTKIKAAGGEAAFKALSGEAMQQVYATASQISFRAIAVLPAVLLVVFGIMWVAEKMKKAENLEKSGS